MQPKLIYLARRSPGLGRAAFTPRWRQHGALGMSRPRWKNIARYVHCDVLDDSGYDAIGLIWHRSAEHRAAHLADTSSRLDMERDEAATFARPIVEDCLLARETVLSPPAVAADEARKVFAFFTSAPATPLDPRLRQLHRVGAPALGCVRNEALPPERASGWGLRFPLIEEFWFGDDDSARRAAAQLQAQGAASAIITNHVCLYRSP